MIEHYFKFEHLPERAKTRYELDSFTEPIYEHLNFSFIYLQNDVKYVKAKNGRKPNFTISNKIHISSGFIPDVTKPNYAFGDINNSNDLLIFVISNNIIEVFVCRDKKHYLQTVLNLLFDGELDEEIKQLRTIAKRINK